MYYFGQNSQNSSIEIPIIYFSCVRHVNFLFSGVFCLRLKHTHDRSYYKHTCLWVQPNENTAFWLSVVNIVSRVIMLVAVSISLSASKR